MNKKKWIIFGITLIGAFGIIALVSGINYYKFENEALRAKLEERPTEIEVPVDVYHTDTVYVSMFDDETSVFSYTYPRFKVFNKNIDTCTVEKFAEVMNYYELDTTQDIIELYVGQILLESGAKQYRPSGNLVVSSAGAIGMCQILPSTCYGYMKKYITEEDSQAMYNLGASDFSFAFNEEFNKAYKVSLAREWLSEETNNMIMWGYITKNNIDRKGDIMKQLVSYNAGTSGMNRFLNNGNNIESHSYIRGIRKKINVAEDDISLN